ncbi:MAG: hypothetical protein ACQKBU_07905, partial [Verrucomicrobiales bacterium]
MKVLLVHPNYKNPYVEGLKVGLRNHGVDVHDSAGEFWMRQNDYDLIHLHWPESMFLPKTQRSWWSLSVLKDTIYPHWKANARVVTTRHNRVPHNRCSLALAADQLA